MTQPFSQSSIEDICNQIHASFGNPRILVQIFVCQLTPNELCQKTRQKFIEMYGEDLFDHFQNKIYGDETSRTGTLFSLLMLNPHERDAIVAKNAIFKERDSVNYKALIEIYVGRKSSHFFLIQQAYQNKFSRQLDQDIMSIEPPHSYQKILLALGASQKAHIVEASVHIGRCDAQRLFQTREARCGGFKIDEGVVLEILSKRSIQQLRLTFSIYKHIYGHGYTKHFKNEYGGDFEDALNIVVKFLNNPPKYHAKELEAIIKGRTKDEGNLERIIMSQSETDLNKIRKYYQKIYGMDLTNAILDGVPIGDFRDLLLALIIKSNIN